MAGKTVDFQPSACVARVWRPPLQPVWRPALHKVAGRDVPYRADGDSIHVETPSIGLHEVVAVDFSA